MPKRKEPELDPKEQFKRFQKAAKEREVSEKDAQASFSHLARRKARRSDPSDDKE